VTSKASTKEDGADADESGADQAKDRPDEERLANGPIYLAADAIMRAAHSLSLVERLKKIAIKVRGAETKAEQRRISNWVVDIFVVTKWVLVVIGWTCGISNWLFVSLIGYLLIWNGITYFYYHLWMVESPKDRIVSAHRERRRFVSLVLAMAFSMVTYAYVYQRVLPDGFEWPASVSRYSSAITFSIGNALTSQAGGLRPVTGAAYLLSASQLVFTFGFVAMLLSSSLPRVRPS
jgi:hypothetical protein